MTVTEAENHSNTANTSVNQMLLVKGAVQQYAWGIKGDKSLVGRLAVANGCASNLSPSESYAEFWIGDHPSGMNHIPVSTDDTGKVSYKRLDEYMQQPLPYLLKVLSVDTPLSIQSHPDISTAKDLHAKRPDIYKDPNHKPEMAIALGDFEALCGFKDIKEIISNIKRVPELQAVLGEKFLTKFKETLDSSGDKRNIGDFKSSLVEALLTCPDDTLGQQQTQLRERLSKSKATADEDVLFLKLDSHYLKDPGCFFAFLLQHLRLKDGEALYIGPNTLHAYIKGDCIECMACSDNVIRGGLTPKFKDADLLCKLLRESQGENCMKAIQPESINAYTHMYRPPADEFQVCKVSIQSGQTGTLHTKHIRGPALGVVLQGTGQLTDSSGKEVQKLSQGSVIYIHTYTSDSIFKVHNSGDENIVIYMASCPSN